MEQTPAQVPESSKTADPNYLKDIAEHLASIRGMLKFFTFITVMYILLSIANFVLSL